MTAYFNKDRIVIGVDAIELDKYVINWNADVRAQVQSLTQLREQLAAMLENQAGSPNGAGEKWTMNLIIDIGKAERMVDALKMSSLLPSSSGWILELNAAISAARATVEVAADRMK